MRERELARQQAVIAAGISGAGGGPGGGGGGGAGGGGGGGGPTNFYQCEYFSQVAKLCKPSQ